MATNPIILHDNTRAHTADAVKDLLRSWRWEILDHPPYSWLVWCMTPSTNLAEGGTHGGRLYWRNVSVFTADNRVISEL
jgi:hypothetical protein